MNKTFFVTVQVDTNDPDANKQTVLAYIGRVLERGFAERTKLSAVTVQEAPQLDVTLTSGDRMEPYDSPHSPSV
jgi:hypothetical protein